MNNMADMTCIPVQSRARGACHYTYNVYNCLNFLKFFNMNMLLHSNQFTSSQEVYMDLSTVATPTFE
jgi:hypothetical protein